MGQETTPKVIYWNRFCTIVNAVVMTASLGIFVTSLKRGEWILAVTGAALLLLSHMVRVVAGDLGRLQEKLLQSDKNSKRG